MSKLYCGDNLEILKTLPSESVDLIYIDPPFFTNRKFEVIWNDGAETRQFDDRWVKLEDGKYSKDINVYLNWMEPRLREMHRVLKFTGSMYLHCDDNAVHYLKILMDQIFGMNRFVNQIQWKRSVPKNNIKNSWGDITDYILFYSKSSDYRFNPQYSNIQTDNLKEYKRDENGWFRWSPLTTTEGKEFNFRGTTKKWRFTKQKLEQMWNDGLIRTDKNGQIMSRGRKRYVDIIPTPIINNMWNDINSIKGKDNENLGYPTQKPEALLERIIKASSNEGDVVMDAFSGGGTTVAVAKRLNREFISIEVSPTANRIIADRLDMEVKDIAGYPLSEEEVGELDG